MAFVPERFDLALRLFRSGPLLTGLSRYETQVEAFMPSTLVLSVNAMQT
jgi:hypothetical protein